MPFSWLDRSAVNGAGYAVAFHGFKAISPAKGKTKGDLLAFPLNQEREGDDLPAFVFGQNRLGPLPTQQGGYLRSGLSGFNLRRCHIEAHKPSMYESCQIRFLQNGIVMLE